MAPALSGTFSVLFQFDVCEAIRLDELRRILNVPPAGREPFFFRHPAPEYVQFARPPVVETALGPLVGGARDITGRIAYYDYGVVSLRLELPFAGGWSDLIGLAARWINDPGLEPSAVEIVKRHLERAAPALVGPYPERLSEDYFVIHVLSATGPGGEPLGAPALIERFGGEIAQVVRGEPAPLSAAERAEILEPRMSYYDSDLLVVGWTAAFLYDTPEGAAPTLQLLEYANTQLLEFRHYDAVLTRLLAGVYHSLERGTGFLARWRLAREAARLGTIRLDVRDLTERMDNSIKFLSDMFAARLYRTAAARIGVPDYRTLVEQKLQSAGDLYAFMMDRFYQGRAFVMELMIIIILLIDLAFLFRGK